MRALEVTRLHMIIKVFVVANSAASSFSLGDGFKVIGVATSELAANRWLAHNPGRWHLAIIDPVLADGSGYGVIRRCKAAGTGGSVVVLADFLDPYIADRCKALGADAVFKKSQTQELAAFCNSLLSRNDNEK